jgi:hypothetical protein
VNQLEEALFGAELEERSVERIRDAARLVPGEVVLLGRPDHP